jgi:ribosomal peptide maturation radical SAM protein 1
LSERVILINMPFGAIERPALSLGLLKAHCERIGVPCDVRYFTLDFAERIGLGDYLWLCSEDVPYTAFVGEWVFAEALYGARPDADAEYIEEVLRNTWRVSGADLARFRRVRTQAVPFLDDCLRSVKWSDYTLVGFTSVFQQNLASLAIADRLKRAHPEITIAFGGANWEEMMGVALQAAFPFVDLAFSGEADETFPSVLRARREQRSVEDIAGVTVRGSVAPASVAPIGIMDAVPIPDFDSFFRQFSKSSVGSAITPTLLLETARGCWWGERSHCTFCGLNGATMAFRSKTPDRVLKEIMYLRARHGVRTFNVVDDILDMSYFDTVLPRIADARLDIDFFWEIKANLTHHHIRSLGLAGVLAVQPGIESFSDRVLKLMRKGTTAFRNIEVLKWCREYGRQTVLEPTLRFSGGNDRRL